MEALTVPLPTTATGGIGIINYNLQPTNQNEQHRIICQP
jgi:hypothetical protein